MTRQFETYHSQHLIVALDLGRAMCGSVKDSFKHDYYLSACVSLAEYAIGQGDKVSFVAFADKIVYTIAQTRDIRSFRALYEGNKVLRAREEESSFATIAALLPSLSGQRSCLLVFSDFSKLSVQSSLLRDFQGVFRKHLTVAMSLIADEYTLEQQLRSFSPGQLNEDSFSQFLYSYWTNEQLQVFSRKLQALGAGALHLPEAYWTTMARRLYSLMRRSHAS